MSLKRILAYFRGAVDDADSREIPPVVLLAGLYAVAHLWMLLTNGVFWDDWRIVFDDDHASFNHYLFKGQPFFILLNYLARLAGESMYFSRFLTFLAMLSVNVFSYLILRKVRFLTKRDAFFSAALLAVLPQYYSRMCLMMFPYTASVAIFFAAFFLITIGYHRRGWARRLLVVSMFFVSFTLGSLLVFYLIPFCFLYFGFQSRPWRSIRASGQFLKTHLDFLFLPIAFYFLSGKFFPAREWFAGYNAVSTQVLPDLPRLLRSSFDTGFVRLIHENLRRPYWGLVLLLLVVSLYRGRRFEAARFGKYVLGLVFSGALFFLGVFPYAMAGKMIEYYYVGDRNAVLALFGIAFGIYFFLSLVFVAARSETFKTVAVAVCLALFMVTDIKVYHSFLRAAIKQDSFIQLIPGIPEFEKGRTFRVVDHTSFYVPKETPYQQPQLTGLIRWVFKTPNRCAHHTVDECLAFTQRQIDYPAYIVGEYKPDIDRYLVTIDYGPERLAIANTFRLTFLKLFSSDRYRAILPEVLRVAVSPLIREAPAP